MPDDLVTLTTFQSASDAEPLRIALEENGIQAFVADGNTVTANWLWGPALGYVKVQVPSSQADAAREIMSQHVPASEGMDPDDRPATCLACGTPMPGDTDTCPKCGWSFNAPEPAASDPEEPT